MESCPITWEWRSSHDVARELFARQVFWHGTFRAARTPKGGRLSAFWSVLSYVAALTLFLTVGLLGEAPLLLVLPVLRRVGWLFPMVRLFKEAGCVVLAAYLLTLLTKATPLHLSGLMVLIPFWMEFHNDRKRIAAVKANRSATLLDLQATGEDALRYQRKEFRIEYGSLLGHLTGYTLVFSFILERAPFI